MTFDDPITREQAIADPQLLLDSLGTKVIIDEIQPAPKILSYIKVRVDSRRAVKGQYVFAGSQQFSLIKNLGDSLAGRIGQLLNLSSFASGLGVSVSTIKSWLSILEAGRIIYLLPPYYNNDDRLHARDHCVRVPFRLQDHGREAPVEGYPAGDAERTRSDVFACHATAHGDMPARDHLLFYGRRQN